jgi:hypothetical protein
MAKFSDIKHPEQKLILRKKIRWEGRLKNVSYVLNTALLILVVYLLLR